ncbi:hypothetical protein MKW92_045994, partial [Papaver armeniacum]
VLVSDINIGYEDIVNTQDLASMVENCDDEYLKFELDYEQYSSTSSGFIISGRKVLTNAHSVEHYTQVKLKKRGSDVKYLAKVLAIGSECDIAMLTVEDDEFWDGVSPVQFGSLPALQDAVTVVGYPIGGDTISVTSGVAHVIPTTVVMHFIEDYDKKEEYTGTFRTKIQFPNSRGRVAEDVKSDLRAAMGMTSQQKGVRITRFEPTSPEYHFDGIDIANDGTGKSIMFTFLFTHGERIAFSYLISQKYTGENAIIEVLRDSKILEFNIKLATINGSSLQHQRQPSPSYYIVAGFVFYSSIHSISPFRGYGKENEQQNIAVKLLDKHLFGMVLVADINIGYEDIVNTEVFAFNGYPVKNLKGLASMVENCVDEYLKFELDYQHIVVLETKAAKAATPDILSTHCIPSAMSADINT